MNLEMTNYDEIITLGHVCKVRRGKKWGICDKKSGKELIQVQYDCLYPLREQRETYFGVRNDTLIVLKENFNGQVYEYQFEDTLKRGKAS